MASFRHSLGREPALLLWFAIGVAVCIGSCSAPKQHESSLSKFQPPDSLLAQGLAMSVDSMGILEQTFLSDREIQTIYVAGVWYQRFLGDRKFRRIDEYDYDNLRDFPRETVFDVILDLRDSSQLSLSQTIADTLVTTDQSGFFRCFLTRKKLRMLILNGVVAYAAVVFEKHDL